MKILVCDNAGMVLNSGRLSCHEQTGMFGENLKKCGHDVTYFQFSVMSSRTINGFDLEGHGIKCNHVPFKGGKLRSYVKALIKSVKAVAKSDFVYQFAPSSFIFVSIVALILGKPYGFYVRGMKQLDTPLYRFLFKHAKTVLTVSNVFTDDIKAYSPKVIVETIKPMVEVSVRDKFERAHFVKPKKFNITFLARLDKDKGLYELIKAASIIKKSEIHKFEINIYGDGGYHEDVVQFIDDFNVADVVKMRGKVVGKEALLKVMRACDIYILPTYHEGFPRTLYEAMISSAPIITTLVGGIPGLMNDSFNCISIEPKSTESIVEKLNYLMTEYETVAPCIAKNGMNTVVEVLDSARPSHAKQLHNILSNE